MLIDFTVENYRSIKQPVTLSAIAHKGRTGGGTSKSSERGHIREDENIAPAEPVAGRDFELLPVLGIFGANASGKSNVLMAFDKLLEFMAYSNTSPYRYFLSHFIPFGLDNATLKLPTRFRLRSVLDGTVYTYTLVVTSIHIVEEKLEWMPPSPRRNGLLFSRLWNDQQANYSWKNGPHLQGFKKIQANLKEDETFMSLFSTYLNVEEVRAFINWVSFRWPGLGLGHEVFDQDLSMHQLNRMGPEWKDRVVAVIQRFDTGITNIEIEKEQSLRGNETNTVQRLVAVHRSDGKEIRWPFTEESSGTQRLFALISKVLSCLEQGALLLMDELGSNIHPHITHEIVRLFQNPKTNPKRAQLIFTSHDNTLQRRNLLRRDQIWFTQKRGDNSTELYPLTDFGARNDLAIDKAYLDGRFNAVPILPRTEDLLAMNDSEGLSQDAILEAIVA